MIGEVPESSTRIVIVAVAVLVAVVVLAFATGWANDRAKPGSSGRVKVTAPATESR
jgi:hypothetical protein